MNGTNNDNYCICKLLKLNKKILIDKNVFHNNICFISKKIYNSDNDNFEFFCNYVEYNCVKFEIRDATIEYLCERLQLYYSK